MAKPMDATKLWPGEKVRARVGILPTRTDLKYHPADAKRASLPAGTLFRIGGVHQVERWADLEAENLVGLKLRLTFEEIGRLIEYAS